MSSLILMTVLSLFLSGCSMLPRFTFEKPGATATQTSKSSKDERCAGEYKVDEQGNIISCSKGYINKQSNYAQKDRTYTWWEKICNWARALTGWGVPLFIAAAVFIPGFGGAVISLVLNNIFGVTSKGFRGLVKGIQKGKQYVQANGTKYTPEERLIYLQGADDILQAIDDATENKEIEKLIYQVRAEMKWEKK